MRKRRSSINFVSPLGRKNEKGKKDKIREEEREEKRKKREKNRERKRKREKKKEKKEDRTLTSHQL